MKLRELLMIATGVTLLARGLRSAGAVCWLRRHDPRRQFVGGLRCSVCGLAGESYEDFAFGTGYVAPVRRTYERTHGTVTRSSDFPSEKTH